MGFRSSQRIKQEFLKARTAQSDVDFLSRCGLKNELADSALRVRAAIANLAGVDACRIHAEDTFHGDLAHFDFWGSLDSIAVILELEKCLAVRISEAQAHRIVDPESVPRYTVAEFVKNVVQVVAGEKGTSLGPKRENQ
jgi:acyl carrier protein